MVTSPAAKLITAVIVNHDQWPATWRQVEEYHRASADAFTQTEWRIIDNGDVEAGLAPCPARSPELAGYVAISRRPNRGYGEAVNHVLSNSHAPFVLALNADLCPEPDFLERVHACARQLVEARSRVGIVGFGLLNEDGSPQGSAGRFPTLLRVVGGLMRKRHSRKYIPVDRARPTHVPWVTGACVLLDRRCMTELGGFDERYFLYYEDVDLCRRAWKANWRVELDPGPRIRHLRPYHSRPLTIRMVYLARRAMLLYFWNHRPAWEFRILARIVALECRLRRRASGWPCVGELLARLVRDPQAEPMPDVTQLPD